jgi:hypothetical protein
VWGNSKAEETERFHRQSGAKRAANGSFSSIKVCAYHSECYVSNPGRGYLISHSSSSSLAVSSSLSNAGSGDFVFVISSSF